MSTTEEPKTGPEPLSPAAMGASDSPAAEELAIEEGAPIPEGENQTTAQPQEGAPPRRDSSKDNLGHKTSRGVAITAGGLWSKTIIQTVGTVVLARLLDPKDFGLVAMVTAIVGVADLVRDFGMTGAILQSRTLTDRMWGSVLWLSGGVGLILTLITAACAPLIAQLYGEPSLIILTLAISPILLINGLCMPLQAKVQRDLRFGLLARNDMLSMLVGTVGAIITAFAGWGLWSLVVLAGAGQIYRLISLWVAAQPTWGRPHIDRDVMPLVTTGGSIFGVQLLNYAARNVDNVVVGQQLGAAVLGQYTRAYSLFLLPLQQLTGPLGRVALPVLSKLQDDSERYRRYIRGAIMVIGYCSLPTYAVASAVSTPLIRVLLGAQWTEAALIFSILSIAGVAQAIGNIQGWLYITLGRAHRQLIYYIVTRPMIIAGFFFGVWWGGVNGLALIYGLLSVALLVPGFGLAIRGTFVTWRDLVGPVLRPALLVPFSFGLATLAIHLCMGLPDIISLIAGLFAGVAPTALAMLIPAYRRDLMQIVSFVKQMRKPKAAVGATGTPGTAS